MIFNFKFKKKFFSFFSLHVLQKFIFQFKNLKRTICFFGNFILEFISFGKVFFRKLLFFFFWKFHLSRRLYFMEMLFSANTLLFLEEFLFLSKKTYVCKFLIGSCKLLWNNCRKILYIH